MADSQACPAAGFVNYLKRGWGKNMSDIKFNGEEVIVEGNWLKARVLDLKMDHPSRRTNNAGERRALVHDFSDGLTINYASDYPGGVTINGIVKSDNRQFNLATWDLCLDHPSRRSNETPYRRALVHDGSDGLTINYANDYPGGVTIRGNVNVPTKLTVAGKDVAARLTSLQTKVEQLEARVADLES